MNTVSVYRNIPDGIFLYNNICWHLFRGIFSLGYIYINVVYLAVYINISLFVLFTGIFLLVLLTVFFP